MGSNHRTILRKAERLESSVLNPEKHFTELESPCAADEIVVVSPKSKSHNKENVKSMSLHLSIQKIFTEH